MVCTFCGHGKISYGDDAFKMVTVEIEHLAVLGVTTFYSGGYGNFDKLAVKGVYEVKKKIPAIKNVIVVPYITQCHLKRYEFSVENYDAFTIYPFETKVLPKFAISKRNEWMVDNSDYVIACVKYDWGGAFNMLKYAINKKKTIIYV